jgi:hypothetical protein
MSGLLRYCDEQGNLIEREVRDPWRVLERLDERFPPVRDLERDRRFEEVMRRRRHEAAKR